MRRSGPLQRIREARAISSYSPPAIYWRLDIRSTWMTIVNVGSTNGEENEIARYTPED
jgi:hypothetical protein